MSTAGQFAHSVTRRDPLRPPRALIWNLRSSVARSARVLARRVETIASASHSHASPTMHARRFAHFIYAPTRSAATRPHGPRGSGSRGRVTPCTCTRRGEYWYYLGSTCMMFICSPHSTGLGSSRVHTFAMSSGDDDHRASQARGKRRCAESARRVRVQNPRFVRRLAER